MGVWLVHRTGGELPRKAKAEKADASSALVPYQLEPTPTSPLDHFVLVMLSPTYGQHGTGTRQNDGLRYHATHWDLYDLLHFVGHHDGVIADAFFRLAAVSRHVIGPLDLLRDAKP